MSKQMTSDHERKLAVCRVCTEDLKRQNPHIIGCAWQCLGNEFCTTIQVKADKYGFPKNWLEGGEK